MISTISNRASMLRRYRIVGGSTGGDALITDFSNFNDFNDLIDKAAGQFTNLQTFVSDKAFKYSLACMTNLFRTLQCEFAVNETTTFNLTHSTGYTIVIPPRDEFTEITITATLDESKYEFSGPSSYIVGDKTAGVFDFADTLTITIDSTTKPIYYYLNCYNDYQTSQRRIRLVSINMFNEETQIEWDQPHQAFLNNGSYEIKTNLEKPLFLAVDYFFYYPKCSLTDDENFHCFNYAVSHSYDDLNWLLQTLANKVIAYISELEYRNPVTQALMDIRVFNMSQQNTLQYLVENTLYYSQIELLEGKSWEFQVAENAPSYGYGHKYDFTFDGNLINPTFNPDTITQSWNYDSVVINKDTIGELDFQFYFYTTYEKQHINGGDTVYTIEVINHAPASYLITHNHKAVTRYRVRVYYNFKIRIFGRTLPGSIVEVTPLGIETNNGTKVMNFDTVVDTEGTFTSDGIVTVYDEILYSDTYTAEGTIDDPDNGDYLTMQHALFNFSVKYTIPHEPIAEITPSIKWSGTVTTSKPLLKAQINSPLVIKYIRVPLYFSNISTDSTQLELQAVTIKNFIKNIQQDFKLQALEYRMEEIEKLTKVTSMGVLGGFANTASTFLGAAKLAISFQKIAEVFFSFDAILQGRWLSAFMNMAGAGMSSVISRKLKKHVLDSDSDLIGSLGKKISEFKSIMKYKSVNQNYDTAPFDVNGTGEPFIALVGQPIKQINKASTAINNAFLNIEPSDPNYQRFHNLKQKGYMPEHHSLVINAQFETVEGDRFLSCARMGVAEGAISHTGQFGIGTSQSGNQISNPGILFYYRNLEDGGSNFRTSDYGGDPLLEKKACLAMDGADIELIKDMTQEEIDAFDPRDITMIQNSYIARSQEMAVRTIKSDNLSFDETSFSNIVKSFGNAEFRKNWEYSVPNRTCQSFANAAYENILNRTPSKFLPHEFEYDSFLTDVKLDRTQLRYKVEQMYIDILYKSDSDSLLSGKLTVFNLNNKTAINTPTSD